MATGKGTLKQMHNPDEAILDNIWRSLWKEETIRSIDIHDISVEVEKGQVCLSGHVAKDYNNQRINEIARSIPGVIAVHNHIVIDHDLSIQVARVLGEDERTYPFTLPVYSYHGWVKLGGLVPNSEIQRAAEATAASVQAVRGVILLPDIKDEPSSLVRSAVQPRIGVQVYGNDSTERAVSQVVINPQNRLVTHAIMREHHFVNGWKESCEYLIPVEAMRVVDSGGIILNVHDSAILQFTVFNPTKYPFAPLTWQPPYPYTVGSVRWPRQDRPNHASQPSL